VARYGGEEFVCLLPDTDEYGAQHMAEQLRQRVHQETQPSASGAPWPAVTVSIGVGSARLDLMHSANDLLREADLNLYRAKKAGRNAVRAGAAALSA